MERAALANLLRGFQCSPGLSGLRSTHKPTCMERVPRRYRQVVRSRHQEKYPLSVHFLPREEGPPNSTSTRMIQSGDVATLV